MQPAHSPTHPAINQPADAPILVAEHLRKYFPVHQARLFGPGRVVHALEDASLALYPGRALALVGESGSGKTTIARLLAHLETPTAGTIRFRGAPLAARSRTAATEVAGNGRSRTTRAYRQQVQLVFQDPFASLNPVHRVGYLLSRPLRLHGHARTGAEVREQSVALLERVSLSPGELFLDKYPHQLSGGQRQRVAIARALAARPAVLLADEPVSMLDVSIRLGVLNLLLRLKEQERLGVLFITHDLAGARYFAEDTLVLYAGQMVEGGPSEAVIQNPKHPYTQLLLQAAPDPERLRAPDVNDGATSAPDAAAPPAHGEIPSLIQPPGGCRFHPRCPYAMAICRERVPGRTDLGGGRWTNCFLYGEGTTEERAGHMSGSGAAPGAPTSARI